jgi:predicted acetyltransferase
MDARPRKEGLVLRKLTASDEERFERAHRATAANDPGFARGFAEGMSFTAYLAHLEDCERGFSLPENHVPSTMYWGFVGPALAGRLMLRHRLNERLLQTGGNIGYVVVPEYRRRGIATTMLELALPLARERGLERVLLTCDEDNLASQRVIEKCGGVFEDTSAVPETGVIQRRYWIALQ